VNADIGLLEAQDMLKSEALAPLEALSKNASRWSAISKDDALPAILTFTMLKKSPKFCNRPQ
jgi:hypothetical protein